MIDLPYPLDAEKLGQWLPHRKPALWVDSVLWAKMDEGECEVEFSPESNYCDAQGKLRPTSPIEWMAQAYGLVSACQILAGVTKLEKAPTKVFLVHVKDLELTEADLARGEKVTIHVKRTHQLGPIALVDGVVRNSQERELARAKLKLFAE